MLALKPANLVKCEVQKPAPVIKTPQAASGKPNGAGGGRSAKGDAQDALANMNWQTALFIGFLAWWVLSRVIYSFTRGERESLPIKHIFLT